MRTLWNESSAEMRRETLLDPGIYNWKNSGERALRFCCTTDLVRVLQSVAVERSRINRLVECKLCKGCSPFCQECSGLGVGSKLNSIGVRQIESTFRLEIRKLLY